MTTTISIVAATQDSARVSYYGWITWPFSGLYCYYLEFT